MLVDPIDRLLVAVAPESPDVDMEASEDSDSVTKCGRCRLNFDRHPSIAPGDSSRWSLCPPCRSRLLNDESRTNLRWLRETKSRTTSTTDFSSGPSHVLRSTGPRRSSVLDLPLRQACTKGGWDGSHV